MAVKRCSTLITCDSSTVSMLHIREQFTLKGSWDLTPRGLFVLGATSTGLLLRNWILTRAVGKEKLGLGDRSNPVDSGAVGGRWLRQENDCGGVFF